MLWVYYPNGLHFSWLGQLFNLIYLSCKWEETLFLGIFKIFSLFLYFIIFIGIYLFLNLFVFTWICEASWNVFHQNWGVLRNFSSNSFFVFFSLPFIFSALLLHVCVFNRALHFSYALFSFLHSFLSWYFKLYNLYWSFITSANSSANSDLLLNIFCIFCSIYYTFQLHDFVL
jgi:hypothetical protein